MPELRHYLPFFVSAFQLSDTGRPLPCKASAAGSAASRSEMLASGLGLGDDADAFSVTSTMRHGMGGEGAAASVVESASVSWRAEEEWNSTYTLRLSMVPNSFVPHRYETTTRAGQ